MDISENNRISIIVPVYNAEKYLAACLDSVLAQDYPDWELLAIDDGSTDNSLSIMRSYAEKCERITALSQQNRGVSSARNRGLDKATGKYVVFLDADDILPPSSLRFRCEGMNDAEMFVGTYQIFSDAAPDNLKPMPIPALKMDTETALNRIIAFGGLGYQGYLWNKIFLRSIIEENNIRFCEDVFYNEDRLFVTLYLLHCSTTCTADLDIYHYRTHPDSAVGQIEVMQDSHFDKIMSEFKAFDILFAAVKPAHRQFYKNLSCQVAHRLIALKDNLVPDNTSAIHKAMSSLIVKYSFQALGAHFSTVSFQEQRWCLKQIIGELTWRR